MFDAAKALANDAVGSVIDTVEVDVQFLASVTVTLYVPRDKLVAVADVCPLFHK